MKINHRGETMCGGTVISDRFVLTAGHCCEATAAHELELYIGAHRTDLSDYSQFVEVNRFWIHEEYEPMTLDYDFCLLETTEKIKFGEDAGNACLPAANEQFHNLTNCFIAGYGLTDYGQG